MGMYASSILSKCMSTPPEIGWTASMQTIHYLHQHRHDGLTYSSRGNLEPVCYYDSGFNQRKLTTHPQYCFVIFWCGAPICWRSKRCPITPNSVSQAEFQVLRHAWSYIKWFRELLIDLGLGEWVKRPTLCIGDNRNARDWANEKVISEGNQHLDRHYFIIRERVQKGEILPVWIEGKNNPADVGTKPIDGTVTRELEPYMSGQKEIPLPDGIKVWFGPPDRAELRGNRPHAISVAPSMRSDKATPAPKVGLAVASPPAPMSPHIAETGVLSYEPEPEVEQPRVADQLRHKQPGKQADNAYQIPPRPSVRRRKHTAPKLTANERKLDNILVPGLHQPRGTNKSWLEEQRKYWLGEKAGDNNR
jgi:hypothetical protein